MSTMLNGLIAGLVAFMLWLGVNLLAYFVEPVLFRPVNELTFSQHECDGDDLIVRGFLDKAFWPGGKEAKLESVLGYNTEGQRDAIIVRPLRGGLPVSRAGGEQSVSLVLYDACGKDFVLKLRHVSPWTGINIPSTFGPYILRDDGTVQNP